MVYTNEAVEGKIFSDNEVAKLGYASAFYNQIQSTNRFLNIASGGLPNANDFVDFGPGLARLFRRPARSRFPSHADLYQRRSHHPRGSQR
jgi:hypothetical protein